MLLLLLRVCVKSHKSGQSQLFVCVYIYLCVYMHARVYLDAGMLRSLSLSCVCVCVRACACVRA